MKKVLVVLGHTATGKTDLALELAKKFNGELVSCDSRQVYRGLDIGTGKMPSKNLKFKIQNLKWKIDGINVWMYDVADPKTQFTVKDYVEQTERVIEDILKRGKLPIIVGGTGFYLKALLEGLPNLEIPVDTKLREELQTLPLAKLQEKLQGISPERWNNLNESDRKNSRRLLRSIELAIMNPYVDPIQNLKFKIKNYVILKVGLTAPREVLNSRIDIRLISRIDKGLFKEGERLLKKGMTLERMKDLGLEYGMLAALLAGKTSKEEFIKKLQDQIHQYAKRQMTWFKREKDVSWFDITDQDFRGKVERLVDFWYHSDNDPKN